MRRTGWQVPRAVALLSVAVACLALASVTPDGTVLHFVTWMGGVIIGAAAIHLLVIAFPLREIDTRPPEPAPDRPSELPPLPRRDAPHESSP